MCGERMTSFQIRRNSYRFPSSNTEFKTPSCIQDLVRGRADYNFYFPSHQMDIYYANLVVYINRP